MPVILVLFSSVGLYFNLFVADCFFFPYSLSASNQYSTCSFFRIGFTIINNNKTTEIKKLLLFRLEMLVVQKVKNFANFFLNWFLRFRLLISSRFSIYIEIEKDFPFMCERKFRFHWTRMSCNIWRFDCYWARIIKEIELSSCKVFLCLN